MAQLAALALMFALLAGCSGCASGILRRDTDVSGQLPRAIGLGAFAPACLLFCFVENRTAQGDVQDDASAGPGDVSLRSHTEGRASGGLPPKKKLRKKEAKP